jgi:hypothetical protein
MGYPYPLYTFGGLIMYIVRDSRGNKAYCSNIEEARERYYEFLNACEFVELLKVLIGGTTEQIRRSW